MKLNFVDEDNIHRLNEFINQEDLNSFKSSIIIVPIPLTSNDISEIIFKKKILEKFIEDYLYSFDNSICIDKKFINDIVENTPFENYISDYSLFNLDSYLKSILLNLSYHNNLVFYGWYNRIESGGDFNFILRSYSL